jgi:hypothetical protein
MSDEQNTTDAPVIQTAAEVHGIGNDSPPPTPGLSQSPGLREVPNSQVPAMADGTMISHVFGPGQAAVDPIAAGLDTKHQPLTRNENRVITQTGEFAAGPRPSTYVGKGVDVPQAGPADHSEVPAPADSAAAHEPGPTGATSETGSSGAAPKPEPERPALPAPATE